MRYFLRGKKDGIWAALFLFSLTVYADTLDITDGVYTYTTLSDTTVNMNGISELHITDDTTPISSCTINFNSQDSYLFLENIKPYTITSTTTYLSQIQVNGTAAVTNTNIRVVQYLNGVVIIAQPSTFQPLQVFSDENFQGSAAYLSQYTEYGTSELGTMASNISSFILKRGYTVTFAQNEDGSGHSKNYVAQDCDLEIGSLPGKLNNQINFVRVFPWRWVSKKGKAGNEGMTTGSSLNASWFYNWDINTYSRQNYEYVAIRQQPYWPSLSQNWQSLGINHLLGFNEPDNSVEDAYQNLNNGSRTAAIAQWPPLLATGLRVGAPAVTDGGQSWIADFMSKAEAADLRVDFVPIHYYWSYSNNDYPAGAASQLYNFLKDLHDEVQKPIWLTEFNNGADWTTATDPTYAQNATVIQAMITKMDETPWIERYAIYSQVEYMRQTHYDEGGLTPMGVMYRDHIAPMAYQQEVYGSSKSANAFFTFDTNFRDNSGNGNHPLYYGAPKLGAGHHGNALVLDGVDDYLKLPTNIGERVDFTFAAWVYWNGGDSFQHLFDFGNSYNTGYMYLTPCTSGGKVRFAITKTTNTAQQTLEPSDVIALPTGQWAHVAVTLNGSVGTLYVNGTAIATNSSITINPWDYDSKNNYLGKSQWSTDPLFSGMLDDVLVADYALTADQITTLMNTDQMGQFVTAPLMIAAHTAGSEQSGNSAIQSYDHDQDTRWANDGTLANAWITYDLGTISKISQVKLLFYSGDSRTHPITIAVDGVQIFSGSTTKTSDYWSTTFTPVSGRYVTITMTANNSAGSAWFGFWDTQIWGPLGQLPAFNTDTLTKKDAIEGTVYIGSLADNATDPDSDTLTFSKDSGPEWLMVASDGTLTGTPWDSDVGENIFTVRVTDSGGLYDTAQLTIQVANIYSGVRGLEDMIGLASQWLEENCIDSPACSGADLDGDFDVDMDDFTALAKHWLAIEGLELHLKLDETSGDTTTDSSGNAHTGLLVNDPTWASEGATGGALIFDGTDDYVEVSDYYGIGGKSARTVTAWVKTSTSRDQDIVQWGSSASGQLWLIRVQATGTVLVATYGGGVYSTATVIDGAWHHIAVVLDEGQTDSSKIRLYIDGALDVTVTGSCTINTAQTAPVQLGNWYNASTGTRSGYLLGSLDDVRIYNYALTVTEISQIVQ